MKDRLINYSKLAIVKIVNLPKLMVLEQRENIVEIILQIA